MSSKTDLLKFIQQKRCVRPEVNNDDGKSKRQVPPRCLVIALF